MYMYIQIHILYNFMYLYIHIHLCIFFSIYRGTLRHGWLDTLNTRYSHQRMWGHERIQILHHRLEPIDTETDKYGYSYRYASNYILIKILHHQLECIDTETDKYRYRYRYAHSCLKLSNWNPSLKTAVMHWSIFW